LCINGLGQTGRRFRQIRRARFLPVRLVWDKFPARRAAGGFRQILQAAEVAWPEDPGLDALARLTQCSMPGRAGWLATDAGRLGEATPEGGFKEQVVGISSASAAGKISAGACAAPISSVEIRAQMTGMRNGAT
jgi:hypothetical protein